MKRLFFCKLKSKRGQGMVEFALVMPLLMLILLGTAEFGRLLVIYSSVTSASREAVRYGSGSGSNGSGVPYYKDCTGMQDAASRTAILTAISTTITTSKGNCPSSALVNGDQITATSSGTFNPIVPGMLPMLGTQTISSVSVRSVYPSIQVASGGSAGSSSSCYAFTLITDTGGTVTDTSTSCGSGLYSAFTVEAGPSAGYTFTNWTDQNSNILSTNTKINNYPLSSAITVTANFTPTCYTLTASGTNGTIGLNPTNSTGCSTGQYIVGESVVLTPVGNSGYGFSSWGGAISGTSNPYTYTMPAANTTITASFAAVSCYTLTLTVPQVGGVTPGSYAVTPTNCTGGKYNSGTTVTITPTINSGFSFTNFTGYATASSNPYSFVIAQNRTYNLNYAALACYTLSPTTSPTVLTGGSFSFNTSNSTSLAAGCSGKYQTGTVVTFTASANTGYNLSSWTGNLSGSTNPSAVTMSGNTTVSATFAASCYTLTTTIVPNSAAVGGAGGTVTPGATNCTGGYTNNTSASLNATPASGYTFSAWSGDLSGSTNPTSISMTANKSVTARFSKSCLSIDTTTQITQPSNTQLSITYGNYTLATRTLSQIQVTWPSTPSRTFQSATWGGSSFWSGSLSPTSQTISSATAGWNSSANLGVLDLGTAALVLNFNNNLPNGTYTVVATFDNGCSVTATRTW